MTLIIQFFKERKLGHFFFALGLTAYSWIIASFIPTLGKNIALYMELLKNYPEELMVLLAGAPADPSVFTTEGFIIFEIFALWLPIILFIYAISYGSSIISKEVENGTIENLLSQPVRRSRLVFERALSLLIGILFLIVVTLATLYIFCDLYGASLKLKGLLFMGIHLYTFIAFFGMLHLFLTAVLLERGIPVAVSITFFIASHLLNSLGQTSEKLKDFHFLSVFKYYKTFEPFVDLKFPLKETLGFAIALILLMFLSIIVFNKKDISIA